MKNIAEKLADKWIEQEMVYRAKVAEAMKAGTPFSFNSGRAEAMGACRRELQEAFGLVASQAEVAEMVRKNT